MIQRILIATICVVATALPALAQGPALPGVGGAAPISTQEAELRPLAFGDDTTFEFGIYDSHGERFATAYYRILKEVTGGRDAYRVKYVGRNNRMSESAECWILPETLLPLRSTRKVISGSTTTFFDVAYSSDKIVFRRKRGEGGQVEEQQFSAPRAFYDYESLIWIVPQIEFGEATQLSLPIFDTLNVLPMTLVVSHQGGQTLSAGGKDYPAELYSFSVGATPYKLYAVNQDGQMVPGRIDMAKISFVNLTLDPKKVKDGVVTASKTPAKQPKPVAKPAEEPPAETPAGENPLGPPPPGRRF